MEELKVGDFVLSLDVDSGELVRAALTRRSTHMSPHGSFVSVNGIVQTTPNHPFFVDGEWVEADTLTWEAVEQTVVVGVVNLGSGRFDADDAIQGSDVVFYVNLGADAGLGGGKASGCGCSTAEGGHAWWGLLALLGLPWARRRSGPALSRSPRASSGGPAGA